MESQDKVETIRSMCIGVSAHQKLELLTSLVRLCGYESVAVFGDCFDEVVLLDPVQYPGGACCAVPCCAVLCCAVLCCAVLCCAVLCCAVLCCAVLCLVQIGEMLCRAGMSSAKFYVSAFL